MNILKRVSLSMLSAVDKAVLQIEDQDALIDARIKTMSEQVAHSQVEVKRVAREALRLGEQVQRLQQEATDWERRAASVVQTDRDKARACLQRHNRCTEQLAHYQAQQTRQERLQHELNQQLLSMQDKLAGIRRQQAQMRNRSSQLDIQRVARQLDTTAQDDFDTLFDRWETRLAGQEIFAEGMAAGPSLSDPLEQDFVAQEQRETLDRQLDALLASAGPLDPNQPGETRHD